jgi:hypothetical protein
MLGLGPSILMNIVNVFVSSCLRGCDVSKLLAQTEA